jgi:hypothetical protein
VFFQSSETPPYPQIQAMSISSHFEHGFEFSGVSNLKLTVTAHPPPPPSKVMDESTLACMYEYVSKFAYMHIIPQARLFFVSDHGSTVFIEAYLHRWVFSSISRMNYIRLNVKSSYIRSKRVESDITVGLE